MKSGRKGAKLTVSSALISSRKEHALTFEKLFHPICGTFRPLDVSNFDTIPGIIPRPAIPIFLF